MMEHAMEHAIERPGMGADSSRPDAGPPLEKLRVLNLEDDESDSELIRRELETEWKAVEFLRVETREAFVHALGEFKPDIVLCDFRLPAFDGGSALAIVRQTHPEIPVIMVTGVLANGEAVKLIKAGARDYVLKDHLERLASAVQSALSLEQGIRARKAAEKAIRQSETDIRAIIERSPVAMIVDTGTGADERILLMNRRFTELFGYTLEDIPDIHHWWTLAYPDEAYRKKLKSEWAELAAKTIHNHGDIEPRETTVTCKDGSIRHTRISFSSIGSRNIITFENLTEIRKLEKSLKESIYLNETIMSNANDAIVCVKPEGVIYLWNQKAEEMFGYHAEEAIGQSMIHLLVPQQYRGQATEVLRHFAESGECPLIGTTTALVARRKDGSELPVELSVSCMNVHGEWHATGIIRDITERKQAEADILRLKQLYAVLSRCNQAIVRSKSEPELFAQICSDAVQFGSFRMAWIGLIDPATRRLVPAAGSGEGAEEYLHGLEAHTDRHDRYGHGPAERALRNDRPYWCQDFLDSTLSIHWREHGSALGWRSAAALPLHRDGAVIGAFSLYAGEANAFGESEQELLLEMAEDIDHALGNFSHEAVRREAEESLRKLSLAVEQSPHSIVVTNLDANLEYVNEAFVRTSGYSRAEATGQNPRILQSGKTPRETYDDMWAHLTRGETWKGEFINKRKDGSEYIESTFASPVRNAEGRITHYIGIKEDITERKRLEKELAEQYAQIASANTRLIETNERLERANAELKSTQRQLLQSEKMASIGLLAAGVAHEINNPVGYINSNLGTLEKYLGDIFTIVNKYEEAALPGTQTELQEVQALKDKLDFGFLRDDIQSLLAESREGLERIKEIVLGLKDFSRSSADEAWQWADLSKCLENTLAIVRNELKYKCEVVKEYGGLPEIYCLPSQLEQVFMNLLVNAAQAIETRGTITIRTGQDGDRVWVEITDTGAGIPPDILPHIFDPFFTTKPVGTGTGLGLPVSYGIIERHHGRIEVQSEAGKGSTFRVILPVQPAIDKEQA